MDGDDNGRTDRRDAAQPGRKTKAVAGRSAAELKVEVLDGWQHMVDLAGDGPGRDQRIAVRFDLPLAEVRRLRSTRNIVAHPRRSPTPADLSHAVETIRRVRRRPSPAAGNPSGKVAPDSDAASAGAGQPDPPNRSRNRRAPRGGRRAATRPVIANRSRPDPWTLAKAWDEAHRMHEEREAQAAWLDELRREQQDHDAERRRRQAAERLHPANQRSAPRVSGRTAGYPARRRLVIAGVAAGVLVASWLGIMYGWVWLVTAPAVALAVVAAGLRVLRIVALVALTAAVVTAVVHLDHGRIPTGLAYLLGAVIAVALTTMTDDQPSG